MAEPPDEQFGVIRVNLEEALRRLREAVLVPAHPDYAASVQQRLHARASSGSPDGNGSRRSRQWLRPIVVAGLALSLVIVAAVSFPDARRAVADLFGLSGVRVLSTPSSDTPRTMIDTTSDFGDRVTLSEARALVSFDVALPTEPGFATTDSVYVQTGPGLESVTLVYRPRPGFPEILSSNVGLILSEYAGQAAPYFDKYVDRRRPPTPVTVDGAWPGLRFAGRPQVLIRGPSGVVYSERPRISAPTLVWQIGEVTYRLEAAIDNQRALDIAATVR
jgi:hypothetical protein